MVEKIKVHGGSLEMSRSGSERYGAWVGKIRYIYK